MKPRPNYSNTSTQHIPTLLAQHLQALAKRSQDLNATDRNIVGRNMLRVENRTSAHAAQAQHCLHEPGQTTTTSCNIHKCCMKNLTIFKFEPTTPNMSQQVATGWPNAHNMLHPTRLRYIALKYCDRLDGALGFTEKA